MKLLQFWHPWTHLDASPCTLALILFVGSQWMFSSGALLRADAKPLSLKMVGADSLVGSMDGCFQRSSKGRGRLPSNLEQCCQIVKSRAVLLLERDTLDIFNIETIQVHIVLFTCEQFRNGKNDSKRQSVCLKHPETSPKHQPWYPHPDSFQLILKEFRKPCSGWLAEQIQNQNLAIKIR